ncbi:MFS transporter [Embleya sp. NPDC127516]|uniref:MFS transporter n=1 Tax=Embleya sp. NPDC127516 TaxID=3363990 RepID=UPI00382CBFE6
MAGRAVQGVGGALLLPGSMSIIRHVFADDRERARAIGIWSGVSGAGLALGPVIGGPLVDAFGWASVFWINVPIGVAGILVGAVVLPEFAERRGRFDVPGLVLGVPAIGALVFALIEGPTQGWGSVRVLAAATRAAGALIAFVLVLADARVPADDARRIVERSCATPRRPRSWTACTWRCGRARRCCWYPRCWWRT